MPEIDFYDGFDGNSEVVISSQILESNSMSNFSAFLMGVLLTSVMFLSLMLSYFLFCPHGQQQKVILIKPYDTIPNHKLPETPTKPFPFKVR